MELRCELELVLKGQGYRVVLSSPFGGRAEACPAG
jgi:hypothetical protein